MGRWGDGEMGRWGDGEIFIKGNYPEPSAYVNYHDLLCRGRGFQLHGRMP
ncbi:hypothetical protein [Moorena producens]